MSDKQDYLPMNADYNTINDLIFMDHDRTLESVYASYNENVTSDSEEIDVQEYSESWPPF